MKKLAMAACLFAVGVAQADDKEGLAMPRRRRRTNSMTAIAASRMADHDR
ncbi:hypothetical protein BANRA_00014 [Klebsiella pneumoniae]|nr:hypothetical protein BANRA_00014 [Klebsiella pneumoniae]